MAIRTGVKSAPSNLALALGVALLWTVSTCATEVLMVSPRPVKDMAALSISSSSLPRDLSDGLLR